MKNLHIALSVFSSEIDRPYENALRMAGVVETAAKEGAEMVVFPELSVTGYGIRGEVSPIQVFGVGRHKAVTLLKETADRLNVVIMAGLAEKSDFSETEKMQPNDFSYPIFLSQAVFIPDKPTTVYRKLHLGPPEVDRFKAGDTLPVFHALSTSFGVQLCYDAHFPELSALMTIKGAEVIIIPHASPRKTPEEKLRSWLLHLTARSYDNSVFVLAVNQVGEYINGMHFPGVAIALNPSGELIASYTGNVERLLHVELKKEDMDIVRGHRMRYFLPNRRDDLADLPS